MKITYNGDNRLFHLSNGEVSYAFRVTPENKLMNLYWGPSVTDESCFDTMFISNAAFRTSTGGVHEQTFSNYEFRTREPNDFGEPCLFVTFPDGVRGTRLLYQSHTIRDGSLSIVTRDELYPLEVILTYQTYGGLPLISRGFTVKNLGNQPLTVESAQSASWHLPAGRKYRLTHMAGSWGSEYLRNRHMLTQSRTVLQNTRLTCASAQQLPFFALDIGGEATEAMGEVYYGVLHWSGDFKITVEAEYGNRVCVTGGINDFDFQWLLKPSESFTAPLFTAGYSARGFERMSEALFDFQYDYLCPRGQKTDKAHGIRPVIYNSWYPFEFSVCESNILGLIGKAADIGAELFVIDDGWMQNRTDSKAGLGDWTADKERFPKGLGPIASACHDHGLLFGLWVEPEMVNPDSDLYRGHPDWVISDPTRVPTQQRNQLILNLARDEIADWIIEWLDDLITSYNLDYLKWDMNRYVTESGWADAPREEKKSISVRYIHNLYRIWEHLNRKFPDLLLENCASGGGRADFGMAPYADRINRSDNADPIDVMILHEGFTTLFIPKNAGGAGNIAPAVISIHGRKTDLDFRIHMGMTGSMSIGIDLLTAPSGEMDRLRDAIREFKEIRADLQDSYVVRIASAYEHPYAVFQYLKRDRAAFTLFAFAHGMRNWDLPLPRFRIRGLKPEATYEDNHGNRLRGEALMNIGLCVDLKGDYSSSISTWHEV